jgi:hypothetical protein
VPSGGLVPYSNPNQSVMNMFGAPKYTVNNIIRRYGECLEITSKTTPINHPASIRKIGRAMQNVTICNLNLDGKLNGLSTVKFVSQCLTNESVRTPRIHQNIERNFLNTALHAH